MSLINLVLPDGNKVLLCTLPIGSPFMFKGNLYVKQALGGTHRCPCYNLTTMQPLDLVEKESMVTPVKVNISVEYL